MSGPDLNRTRRTLFPLRDRTRRWIVWMAVLFIPFAACSRPPVVQPPTPGDPTVLSLPETRPASTPFPPGPNPNTGTTPGLSDPVPVAPTTTPEGTQQAHSHPLTLSTQYTLTAELDYGSKILGVEAQVTYANRTEENLTELLLVVDANRRAGVFRLDSVTVENGEPPIEYTLEGIELRLLLDPPLPPGERIRLTLVYGLDLPDRSGALGYTPYQVNLGDWYPYVPPYDPGSGWSTHSPWAFGEHLVYDVADFHISLRLAEPVVSGVPLTVAASAPVEIDGEWHRYRLEKARSFAISVSPFYELIERETESGTILSYTFSEHRAAGEAATQAAADALTLYSQLFGPYPHRTLSLVEASFGDGMEFEGLVFVSQGFYHSYDGTARNYLTLLTAHETAHQWWYGQVGNDQALEPWLDEALCTYSEVLFYERFHPDDLDWWWLFRVQVYGPQGVVNAPIYEYAGFRPYVNAVYLQGAQFLNELREGMGEQAFLDFLREYASQYAHEQATAADFFSLLEKHATLDLSPLLERYFTP